MKNILIIILLILSNIRINNFTFVDKEINIFKKIEVKEKTIKKEKSEKVLATYTGYITAYGPDCKGCSGITSSGYNVTKTIYYNDSKYGKVRILAADKKLSFGTIVRIKNLKNYKNSIIAIVLDRGGAIGFKKSVYFDLLYKSEKDSNSFGKRKATFEILRNGF